MYRWRWDLAIAALAISSCSSSTTPFEPSTSSVASTSIAVSSSSNSQSELTVPLGDFNGHQLGATGCRPPSPIVNLEVRGTSPNGELYGLIMVTHSPIRPGDEVKIVVRMTGTGDFRASLEAPDGRSRPLAWGPDAHSGSNYQRPGDEWGVGYVFDQPGCWHLGFARSDTTGDIWLQIER